MQHAYTMLPRRFGLPAIFAIMLLVAVLTCWWCDHSSQARQIAMLKQQISLLKGELRLASVLTIEVPPKHFNDTPRSYVEALRRAESRTAFYDRMESFTNSASATDAAPLLVDAMDDADNETLSRILISLAWMAKLDNLNDTNLVVEELTTLLTDVNLLFEESFELAYNVFWVLREIGTNADAALGALRPIMSNDESPLAGQAVLTVHAIDPTVEIGIRLSRLLHSKHDHNRAVAAQYLVEYVSPDVAERLLRERHTREVNAHIRETIAASLNKLP